ncbi:MAG: CinA family protein [Candidatus Lokiarchaeia archaeon]|nr:CinA family protein [Candidatus Lokiarchaeia archaeon]
MSKLLRDFTDMEIKIAIAESCTGGFISHMFTNISGASKVFERGIVCYSNQSKIDLLNVDPQILEKYGAVSNEVVMQLANNVRVLSNVDMGIGISGIAGPTGGTPEKPVGLVFIGISTENELKIQEYKFKTDRISFKKEVLEKLIQLLEELY